MNANYAFVYKMENQNNRFKPQNYRVRVFKQNEEKQNNKIQTNQNNDPTMFR